MDAKKPSPICPVPLEGRGTHCTTKLECRGSVKDKQQVSYTIEHNKQMHSALAQRRTLY